MKISSFWLSYAALHPICLCKHPMLVIMTCFMDDVSKNDITRKLVTRSESSFLTILHESTALAKFHRPTATWKLTEENLRILPHLLHCKIAIHAKSIRKVHALNISRVFKECPEIGRGSSQTLPDQLSLRLWVISFPKIVQTASSMCMAVGGNDCKSLKQAKELGPRRGCSEVVPGQLIEEGIGWRPPMSSNIRRELVLMFTPAVLSSSVRERVAEGWVSQHRNSCNDDKLESFELWPQSYLR